MFTRSLLLQVTIPVLLLSALYQLVSYISQPDDAPIMVQVGDSLPEGTKFSYVPYDPSTDSITSCGIPVTYDASKEWADKKVVLFAVPGAFTPGCSARHLPGYIAKREELLARGVDVVACVAYNDAFVMSAWSKANGVKNDDILFLSDAELAFSKRLGWTLGERTARYALVVDRGKIVYAEKEESPKEVSVSGAEAVLAKL
ncbi:putative peroxiredoxin prxA [Colletotrichum orbiculare MAFF 240422]|uniref:Thioredoxin peroxidase n=1 Tax=Colletotrichum orbiculare (strain 104-T / ATCC 96160 / CBS 514.97 / LARS 414 / MAFF 240422) TaxID=1213857 RepID=N4VTI4_COLOR|nr:putative peroxiredoxin prxA [Colletotrichum orbiculare MAFF 240422]